MGFQRRVGWREDGWAWVKWVVNWGMGLRRCTEAAWTAWAAAFGAGLWAGGRTDAALAVPVNNPEASSRTVKIRWMGWIIGYMESYLLFHIVGILTVLYHKSLCFSGKTCYADGGEVCTCI